MNFGGLIFLGTFLAMALSFWGMIVTPQMQIGRSHNTNEIADLIYPNARPGLAQKGLDVYRSEGCATCHSQNVRGQTADIPRWGKRISVGADYLFDYPVMIGAQRFGPDLSNEGVIRGADTNGVWMRWHLEHLYAPQAVVPGSMMPRYKYLFEERPIRGERSDEALQLTGKFAPKKGFEVVPKPEAYALVAYLQSLKSDINLFEAPLPLVKTNAPANAGGTNVLSNVESNGVPASSTNASAATNAPAP